MTKFVALIGLWITTLCAADTSASSIQAQHTTHQKAKIQVALILDTSGSMDGLLEQAKSQLWKMVNNHKQQSDLIIQKVPYSLFISYHTQQYDLQKVPYSLFHSYHTQQYDLIIQKVPYSLFH